MKFHTFMLMVLLCLSAQGCVAKQTAAETKIEKVEDATPIRATKKTEAQKIGEMVQKLQVAMRSPNDPRSLGIISLYGNDRRYYSMVLGWLFQELIGVESKLHASKSYTQSEVFQHHSNFLKQAIRSVNLK